MKENYNHTFIETNGIRLHVVLAGPEAGRLVILLHGFPEFWYAWRSQIPPLAEAGYRVVVPDQRGYNLSEKPERVAAYSLDTLAQDIIGLIQALGRKKAYIVGHDWGAAVAWQLVTYHPEWVEKLAILNVPHPAVMSRALRRDRRQLRKSWYMFYFQIPWLPERMLAMNNFHALADTLQRTSRPGTFTDEDLVHYKGAWAQPGAITAMINWYRNVVQSGMRYLVKPMALPSISVPTLVLWGKKDFALEWRLAEESLGLCKAGRLVFFENATHWVQHEEAEGVNQLLLE